MRIRFRRDGSHRIRPGEVRSTVWRDGRAVEKHCRHGLVVRSKSGAEGERYGRDRLRRSRIRAGGSRFVCSMRATKGNFSSATVIQ
jgi:hypothetical protein